MQQVAGTWFLDLVFRISSQIAAIADAFSSGSFSLPSAIGILESFSAAADIFRKKLSIVFVPFGGTINFYGRLLIAGTICFMNLMVLQFGKELQA